MKIRRGKMLFSVYREAVKTNLEEILESIAATVSKNLPGAEEKGAICRVGFHGVILQWSSYTSHSCTRFGLGFELYGGCHFL